MKKYLIKPLLASLLLVGAVSAQAAHFEVIDYVASSRYTGTVDFNDFSYLGSYSSGGESFGTTVSGGETTGDYTHTGYAAGDFLDGTFINLSTSVSFSSPNTIEYYGIATAVEKAIKLKVVADSGDVGQTVNVSFAGLSSTYNNLVAGSEGTYQTRLRVLNAGGSELGNFSTLQMADQNVNFAFTLQAGDVITLSASQGVHMNASGPIDASLSGMFGGEFTVVAVPEPEQYALMLAGLGLIGGIARRRNR